MHNLGSKFGSIFIALAFCKYSSAQSLDAQLHKLPILTSPEKWQSVALVEHPGEILGVYKVGDVIVNGNPFLERTKKALKMAGAMIGGNVVYRNSTLYVTRSPSLPVYKGRFSVYVLHSPVDTYEQSYTYEQSIASVYATRLPDTTAFRKLIQGNYVFSLAVRMKLNGRFNDNLRSVKFQPQDVKISGFNIKDGNIFIHQKIKGITSEEFHVNYFNENKLILSCRNRSGLDISVLVFFIKPMQLAARYSELEEALKIPALLYIR